MTIIRKVRVTASERIDEFNTTVLDVAVIDHNTDDPPASKQVGRSVTVEVEDDPTMEGDALEKWFNAFLEDVSVLILQEVIAKNPHDIYEQRYAHHG